MTDIHIRPEEVKTSGGLIEDKADETRTRIVNLYDSGAPARDGNHCVVTGTAFVAYHDAMRAEMLNAYKRLHETGKKIVAAAQGSPAPTTRMRSRSA